MSYNNHALLCKEEIKLAKCNFLNKDLPKMLRSDPRKLWSTLCPNSANISQGIVSDDGAILGAPEMAVQSNHFFSSVFPQGNPFLNSPLKMCSLDA